jgi:hypothetical protein
MSALYMVNPRDIEILVISSLVLRIGDMTVCTDCAFQGRGHRADYELQKMQLCTKIMYNAR